MNAQQSGGHHHHHHHGGAEANSSNTNGNSIANSISVPDNSTISVSA
jgi:hypothetical protein